MKHRAFVATVIAVLLATAASQAGTRPPQASGGSSLGASGDAQASGARLQFEIGEGHVVRVPASTTTITATNVPGVESMAAEDVAKYAASFRINDSGLARGPEVTASVRFLTPEFIGRAGSNGLTWRVPIEVSAPLGTSHSRLATAVLGVPTATSYAIEYTVSAKPAAAAQWAVRGAADVWTVSWSDPPNARLYSVLIENQDERLSNVRIALSTLKDASGHALGVDRMRLVEAPEGQPSPMGVAVAPNTAKSLFIRLEQGDSGGPFGTFDGVVRFTTDGSSALKDLPLKIQASSRGQKIIGIGSILAGLLLAVSVSALLRPQLARLQIRRATAGLREALAEFELEVGRVIPADAPNSTMKKTAADLAHSISDTTLDNLQLLPPTFALPGAEPATDAAPKLKERLEGVSKKLEGLLVLLRSGAPRLVALLPRDRPEALRLLEELDAAASDVASPQDAQAKVKAVHDKIPTAKESAQKIPERPVSVQEIDFRIHGLSVAAWSIWALVALILGAAWIAADVDYGTTVDLVSSFLWGLGMTTFGASIQNLTPTSVATQLNVKVPK